MSMFVRLTHSKNRSMSCTFTLAFSRVRVHNYMNLYEYDIKYHSLSRHGYVYVETKTICCSVTRYL